MGVTMKTTEQLAEKQGRATRDGVYTLGRDRFRIQKGDRLPEGAVMDPASSSAADEPVQERAIPAAPENRMEPRTPENRSAGKASKAKKDGDES